MGSSDEGLTGDVARHRRFYPPSDLLFSHRRRAATAWLPSASGFTSIMCKLSNWRQQRNLVMADTFLRACETISRKCRILDLYGPTIALTGTAPGVFYKDRDPIHVLWSRERQLSFAGRLLAQVIGTLDLGGA